ncbi:MAG TPA: LamG domain-containing protein, partial [Phycisphaerae bacterium]|nr:LamG domain-containing protein [Phycisphaerae bacterium]
MLLTNRNRGVTIDSDTSFALRGSMLRQVRILFSVWVATLVGASGARAQIELTGTTPSAGQAVNTSSPDLLLDFSGALNVATATTDTIRIYRLGADEVTPATDDTPVPISAISPENGGARLRVTTVNPLPDGDYAWVVYGSASDRSGPGASLHFDGNLATLNLAAFQTLGMNFTWEAWINLECCTSYGGHGFGAIFDVGQNGRNVPGVVLQHNQAAWNFHCYRPDGTESQAIAGDSVVLGAWQHIACSASATGVRLYIDGELAASTPDVCDISAMQSFFNTAISGYTRWAGAYDYILGSIDEMRVWNVARTQAQIRAGMHTPLAGNEAGLLVYYPLDEGAGNSLIDMSQNNYLGGRGSAQWEVSEAPLILMASTVLLGDDEIAVDTNGDALPGGVLVSPFRVDTTSPRVVDLTPALDECPVILYPGSILVQFDDDMDPNSLVPANMALTSAGPDGVIGNADDIAVPYSSLYSEPMRALSILPLSPMTDDAYRLALSDAVVNTSGFSLDGDYPGTIGGGDPLPTGDGLPGGAFVLTFRVNTIDDCNFDGVPDACELVNNDFNVNGVPDECEDCNGNGIADECDISCEAGDGGCNIAGCGLSADCNTNLIPDECEILEGLAGLSPVVRSPINGHHYYLAPTTTWASAKTLAESLGGQLVTIRSAEENQWLVDTFAPLTTATQAHIGFTDAASEGVWVWLSAEPVTFTSWGSGEPNDIGTEDNAIIALQAEGVYVPGDWNDVPASTPRPAIIELSGDADCNQNGVLDECDIASGTSEDCNENDVPDDCEPGGLGDCDDDGVSDLCEFYLGTALDCNDDNIPDACQLDGADCNGNGVPDDCEPDCDGNNVPDDCDLDPLDPDGDGLVGVDCDGNGRPDECDGQLANRALAFDGNDLVTIPQDLVHSRTTLTFEAWFRTSASGVIFGYQNQPFPTAPSNYTPAVYVGTDGLLRGEFYMGSAASIITSASAVDDNQWHHVALAANVNTQRMYLDGQLVGVLAGTINQLNMTHNQIGMGHSASNNWDGLGAGWMGFVGEIDDVRLWSSYRSQQQIVDNMLSIFEPSPSDLLGRWRFNEGYGQTAFDASGMANDGTLGVSGSIEFSDPTWLLSDTGEVLDDCNDNGVLDACDISSGVSIDCNENGVPDECEPGGQSDCDGDGTSDLCEFHLGAGVDCDNNGVPDACELSDGDCNHNDVLDICEVQVANYALDFEQVNDLVRVPDSPDLRPVDELTVEAWIRPDSAGSTHSRIVRHAPFNGAGYILSFQQNSNARIQFRIGNGSLGSAFPTDTVPTSTYFGSWHHVAGVYSASGNFVRVFVDGVLKDEVAAVGPLGLSVSDLSIGNYLSGGERFDGLIDDVRIWNIARSRDQLVDTMFRPLMGNEPGLVGCWRFNEGVGQQVFDASPYHNNGFLGNDDLPVGDDRDPAWSTIASPIPVTDCNENGVLDACDFANGTSLDCNENGTPDDCEPGGRGDCDGNGVSDLCEIYLENSGDCNANAIPDLCELVDNDCNANGIPDDCEVTNNDCNANGVPDDCDIAEGAEDCNENGILDVCELVADNQSLELDGVNDYIQMPNDVWFDGDFTVEAWVNVHQVGYWTRLLDFSNGTPNNNVIIALSDANSGKPTLQVVSGTGSGPPKVTSSVAISLNQWTHMAFVVRGTTGEIYMNGGLVGSGSLYAPLNVVRTRNYIGRSPWSSDAYAKIAVDELRIWNVARTQSEISWNMNLSPSGQSPGLVGYWKFDDGAGQFAADQSSMMRAGVLGGTDAVESADPVWTVGGAVADNDCNGTGGLDECEISDESSADCN